MKVALRNLMIVAYVGPGGGGGVPGINMTAGASLTVDNCLIANILGGSGIFVSANGASVLVTDTVIRGSGMTGLHVSNGARATVSRTTISMNPQGVVVSGGVAATITTADITDSTIDSNTHGVVLDSSNASALVKVSVRNNQIVRNAGFGLWALSENGSPATLSASNNVVSNNGTGISADGSGAKVWASGNTVSDNSFGLFNNGAVLESAGDNAVRNNGTDTSGAITAIPKL